MLFRSRNGFSIILLVLNLSRAIFWPRSSKLSVKKVLLASFYCKPRPSGVSLESSELEYIPLVPANRADVGQNHGALKAVSATVSVLKCRYISAQKLQSGRSKIYAVRISVQTKAFRSYFRVPRTGKYPKRCVKSS